MFVFAGHREPAVPWGVFALPQRCCRSEKDVPSVERLLLLLQRMSYDVSSYVALKGLNYTMAVYLVTWDLNKEKPNYAEARKQFIAHLERYEYKRMLGWIRFVLSQQT